MTWSKWWALKLVGVLLAVGHACHVLCRRLMTTVERDPVAVELERTARVRALRP